ncbi:MAG: hypothetical protein ACJ8GN_08990 [Longimicrobiaceae bacterium]
MQRKTAAKFGIAVVAAAVLFAACERAAQELTAPAVAGAPRAAVQQDLVAWAAPAYGPGAGQFKEELDVQHHPEAHGQH